MRRNLIKGLLALTLGMSASGAALAQNSTMLPTGTGVSASLTVGGWTVTFNPDPGVLNFCSLNSNNNCSPVLATGTVTGGSLTVTFTESGGGNILSLASASSEDLSVFEVVQAPTAKNITSASLSETGQAPTTNSPLLTGSEKVSIDSSNIPGAQLGSTLAVTVSDIGSSVTTPLVTTDTTPENEVYISKDIHASASGNTANAEITQVTQVFNVPEPASLAVLAVGISGLVGLRRRRRQRGGTPG